MTKDKKSYLNEEEDQFTPGCQGKRTYVRVTAKRKQMLVKLAIQGQLSINQACKRAKINNSNGKVLVRKMKAKYNKDSSEHQSIQIHQQQQNHKTEWQKQRKTETAEDYSPQIIKNSYVFYLMSGNMYYPYYVPFNNQ